MRIQRKLSHAQISTQIHSLARSGHIVFSSHAMEEMAKDDLDLADMLTVLRGCRIVEEQPGDKYKVEGRTTNGVPVVAICQLQETAAHGQRVFVITVWTVIKG